MIKQSSTQLHDTQSLLCWGAERPSCSQQAVTQIHYQGRTETLIAEAHHPRTGRTDLTKAIWATQGSRSLGKTMGKRQVQGQMVNRSWDQIQWWWPWLGDHHLAHSDEGDLRWIWEISPRDQDMDQWVTWPGTNRAELNISFHHKEENHLIASWRLFVFLNLTASPNEQGWYLFQHGAGKRTEIARKSKWWLKFVYLSAF